MTKISTIHDRLVTVVAGAVDSSYARIPNPYDVANNSIQYLRRGYGIGFADSLVSRRNVKTQLFESRNFFIVLTREHNVSETDVDDRTALEKDLIEEKFKVAKAIELDVVLTDAIKADYVGDTGLSFFSSLDDFGTNLNTDKFIRVDLTVAVEYVENLS